MPLVEAERSKFSNNKSFPSTLYHVFKLHKQEVTVV